MHGEPLLEWGSSAARSFIKCRCLCVIPRELSTSTRCLYDVLTSSSVASSPRLRFKSLINVVGAIVVCGKEEICKFEFATLRLARLKISVKRVSGCTLSHRQQFQGSQRRNPLFKELEINSGQSSVLPLPPSHSPRPSHHSKGVQKANAKFEPAQFRDQFVKHLESVQIADYDAIASKLDVLGNQVSPYLQSSPLPALIHPFPIQLDYRKYEQELFEILLTGGLLAPGGGIAQDAATRSPFSLLGSAKEPLDFAEIKKIVDVFNKLLRRSVPRICSVEAACIHATTTDTSTCKNLSRRTPYEEFSSTPTSSPSSIKRSSPSPPLSSSPTV